MTNHRTGTIPCTVGILTFNSATYLERCLQGLTDFAEVLIADGGSSDETLTIAKSYGCTIINQSNPGNPINDFALERNRMVDAATYDWFLSLDSDELITPELVEDIRQATTNAENSVYIYRVPYRIVSEDLSTLYASFKTYYQHRFFNRKSGARYTRKIHERITFDEQEHKPGTFTGCWHVPLDTQLIFANYKQKVDHRIRIMVAERPSKNLLQYLRRIIIDPTRNIAKQLIKFVWLRIKHPATELTPLRYEAYKLYSQFVFIKEETRQYMQVLRARCKTVAYAFAYLIRSMQHVVFKKPEVVVLMYHEIDRSGSKLAVSPEVFEQQLAYLVKNHTVVPLAEIYAYITSGVPKHADMVALTFDDGYEDIQTTVLPLLQKYDIPATMFVPSDTNIHTNKTKTTRLNLEQLKTVAQDQLITIGAHGVSHRAFTSLSDTELQEELRQSKVTLEQELGTEISFVAYPYGACNKRVERITETSGYLAAFSITEGLIKPYDNLYHIKRVQVDRTISPMLFRWRLTGAVDLHRATVDAVRKTVRRIKKVGTFITKIARNQNPLLVKQNQEQWDNQFKQGSWDNLVKEQPNTQYIAENIIKIIQQAQKPISVLDVGCGNGGLTRLLAPFSNEITYVGIDISKTAIERAQQEMPEGTFHVADAAQPPEALGVFDVIVFNEVFFYTPAATTIPRYKNHIIPEGVVIVSVVRSWRSIFIWKSVFSMIAPAQKKRISGPGNDRRVWDLCVGKLR